MATIEIQTIRPEELWEQHRSGQSAEIIDVRTPVEYREVHADPARNIPLDTLDAPGISARRNGSAEGSLFVICRNGDRGRQACEKLIAAGCRNVVNVDGGTMAWDKAGLPVVRGKKAVSLERQVRIVAGSLVVLGVLLGWLVHPYCIGLSAFVGAGLVFAGVTDTCGMGMLLARMPWNKVGGPTCTK